MSKLPAKRLSKVQNVLWNYDTANFAIFRDKQMLQTPALVGGARWLSGRVSDSGARGPGFETYRRRVVSRGGSRNFKRGVHKITVFQR